MTFVQELKRRNVFRVGIAYAFAAWLLLQIIDVVVPIIEAPEWVSKALLLLIAVGLPISLVFAWAFELTPEGLKFERDVDRSQSITTTTGRKLDFVIIAVLGAAVVLFGLDKFIWSAAPDEQDVASKRSIAVIPFINMSDDPDQIFFSDGISEEILNKLVRAKGISVASRTSSFSYRNHEQSIPVIAEALGVLYVLEGSVRKAGDQLRITAQLIDAENDRHLWSDSYDRGLTDVFAVQSEIANAITKSIHAELGIESDALAEVKNLTANMTAYDLYLKASLAFNHRTSLQDLLDGEQWIQQAIELDPEFAAAWEMASAIYLAIPYWRTDYESLDEYRKMSNDAARRALSLDPDLAFPEGVLASNYMVVPPYDLITGVQMSERAVKKDPRNATLLNWHGMTLQLNGYFEEGLVYQRRCLEIDPLYMNCVYFMIEGLLVMGRNSEAIQITEDYFAHMLFSEFLGSEAAVYLQAGKPLAARIVASNIIGLDGAPGEEFIKALENPESDHSEGMRKFDAWADENGVDLTTHPEILAAFGAYDRVDISLESELWFWLPLYQNYRQSDAFKTQMKIYGTYDLWKERGFPPQCRPVGDDDFECD